MSAKQEGREEALERVHGTCVALGGAGVLLRGPSGAGKSDLALRLIEAGARLVADDQTELFRQEGELRARAPEALAGLMEVRGLGIVARPSLASAPLLLVVELSEQEPERLPEEETLLLGGEEVSLMRLRAFEDSTPAKIRLAVAQQRARLARPAPEKAADLVIVTGLSGAGRTAGLKALEDGGYEAVDNLPFSLLPALAAAAGPRHPIAVGLDSRGRDFDPDALARFLEEGRGERGPAAELLFITCDDEVLARRFTETRRPHPLSQDRPLADGIRAERALMEPLLAMADEVIDTSELTAAELRRLVMARFGREGEEGLTVIVTSFSFRRGLPREADLVFDVRFLTNPHYQPGLRELSGLNREVADYVMADPDYGAFFGRLTAFLEPLLPRYRAEGKSYLTLAVGCTGGRHRSVAVAEALADWLAREAEGGPFQITRLHRDLPRESAETPRESQLGGG